MIQFLNLNKIPRDKALHAIGGVLILLVALLLGLSLIVAMSVVAVSGIGKEIYDKMHPKKHTADIWDIVATVSLAMLVAVVMYIIR